MGAPVHWTSRAGLLRTAKLSGQPQQPRCAGLCPLTAPRQAVLLPVLHPNGCYRREPVQQASMLGGGTNNV